MKKFIQITYILVFIITSFMVLHALQNHYTPKTTIVIIYFISAFFTMGKIAYCFIIEYLK